MKWIFLTAIFWVMEGKIFAQADSTQPSHSKPKATITRKPSRLYLLCPEYSLYEVGLRNTTYTGALGVQMNLAIGYRFSLLYSLYFGLNNNRQFYTHLYGGAALTYILLAASGGGIGNAGVLTMLIPEGIAYHHPINDHVELSPYIKPFGLEYNTMSDRQLRSSGQAGMQLVIKSKNERILFTPHGGARIIYRTQQIGTVVGFNLGFNLNR